jgi:hypothetical protein
MTLDESLERDILAVLPFGGKFLSIEDVTKRVAPRKEPEVRKALSRHFGLAVPLAVL